MLDGECASYTEGVPETTGLKTGIRFFAPGISSLELPLRGRAVAYEGAMCFCLGVWNSPAAVSDGDAARRYLVLSDGTLPSGFDGRVYAFYSELTRRYPEVEMVPESEIDECPWAHSIEMAGDHVIVPILSERSDEVAPVVVGLAAQYGLTCFDPQAGKVHLPPELRTLEPDTPLVR